MSHVTKVFHYLVTHKSSHQNTLLVPKHFREIKPIRNFGVVTFQVLLYNTSIKVKYLIINFDLIYLLQQLAKKGRTGARVSAYKNVIHNCCVLSKNLFSDCEVKCGNTRHSTLLSAQKNWDFLRFYALQATDLQYDFHWAYLLLWRLNQHQDQIWQAKPSI